MLAVLVLLVLAVAAVLGLAIVGFNRLQRARQGVREAWAQVDTLLQRRFDLVGNLVAVVGAAATHERLAQEAVVAARSGSVGDRDRAERAVAGEARQLLAVAEANPQLRADARFGQLQEQLVRTEDDLAASRRYYNGRVRLHNTLIQTIPWSMLAGPLGFRPTEYFQVDLDERDAPGIALA